MKKIDHKKELKYLYRPSLKKIEEVDVPKMNFLMIDGEGDPNSSKAFSDAVEALYPVAYSLKFMAKKGGLEIDYSVMPLEALWWSDDMSDFITGKKDKWKWTLMIMQPDFISDEMVKEAIGQVKSKKDPISLPLTRFASYHEGISVQTLHIGPFSEEGPTIESLHAYIEAAGGRRIKKHHEIYLSDPRRTAPEKWKTVIRQPMELPTHPQTK